MTKEELENKAEEYATRKYGDGSIIGWTAEQSIAYSSYIAGAKENDIIWHDLRKNPDDLPKKLASGIHRKILVQDRHNNIYTASFYPKDESHKEDCFSVEFISKGFQGANFVAFGQITKWCEFPKFEVNQ